MLCRYVVRSPNEKSLLPIGLIASKFGQRMHAFSQAGGGRGTGIEPSPRHPVRWEGSPAWTACDPSDGGTVFATAQGAAPKCATTFDPAGFLPQTPRGFEDLPRFAKSAPTPESSRLTQASDPEQPTTGRQLRRRRSRFGHPHPIVQFTLLDVEEIQIG
jgi:hypothetical protein